MTGEKGVFDMNREWMKTKTRTLAGLGAAAALGMVLWCGPARGAACVSDTPWEFDPAAVCASAHLPAPPRVDGPMCPDADATPRTDAGASVNAIVEPGRPEPRGFGANSIEELGRTACAAAMNRDPDAVINLMDPTLVRYLAQEFGDLAGMLDEDGEAVADFDPIAVMRQTLMQELIDNPFEMCHFEGAVEAECGDVASMYETPLISEPDRCGYVTLTSKQRDDSEPVTDDIPAMRVDGRWVLALY